MTIDLLIRHWALGAASVIIVAVALFVLGRLYQGSPRGRLAANVARVRAAHRAAAKAAARLSAAQRRLERLQGQAEQVRPSVLTEAAGKVQDAMALRKLADDDVLVAQNHVRKVILEEFPPNRQDRLRKHYL